MRPKSPTTREVNRLRNGFIAMLVLLATAVGSAAAAAPKLIGFSQPDSQTLKIRFDGKVASIRLMRFDSVPTSFNPKILLRRPSQLLGTDTDSTAITLSEDKIASEYSIFVFVPGCRPIMKSAAARIPTRCSAADYFEIVRQTPRWLKTKFNFNRSNGYSILGRRSIVVGGSAKLVPLPPLLLTGKPNIAIDASVSNIPPAIKPYPELVEATKIIRFLRSEPTRTGPVEGSYTKFLDLPLKAKLRLIRDGDYSVQCSGMRDLFLHATAAFPGLRARAVEAVNYAPAFPDLIPYGHSTSEVWVQSLHRWILVDAWMGIVLKAKDGRLLSASDLHPGMSADIEIVPLATALTRFTIDPKGARRTIVDVPAHVRLNRYTQTEFGNEPGYLEYFGNVQYHSYKIETHSASHL